MINIMPYVKSIKYIKQLTLFVLILNFSANLANDIYLPSIPFIKIFFGTTDSMMQLTMTAWFMGIAIPQLLFGPLSDSIGRKPVFLSGIVCFIVATLFCMVSNHIGIFISARFFQGIGVSCLNVTSYAIFSDLYHNYQRRIHVLGLMSACGALSPIIGPIIGGHIFIRFTWRANFFLIFALAISCLIGVLYTLSESKTSLNSRLLKPINLYKNYSVLIRNPNFLRYMIPYCLALGGLVTYLTASPFIFIETFHVNPQIFGYMQAPIFVAYILGSCLISNFSNYIDRSIFPRYGLSIILLSSILMLIISIFFKQSIYAIIFSMVIYSSGLSLCFSPLINEIMSFSLRKGYLSATLGFCMAISCMLLSFLLSITYTGIISFAILFFLVSFSAFLSYFLLGNSKKYFHF